MYPLLIGLLFTAKTFVIWLYLKSLIGWYDFHPCLLSLVLVYSVLCGMPHNGP